MTDLYNFQEVGSVMPQTAENGREAAWPSQELFPEADVKRQWSAVRRVVCVHRAVDNIASMEHATLAP